MKALQKALTLLVLMLSVFSLAVTNVAAQSDIENLTDEVTELFIDLIPLIVILGIFGVILGLVRLKKMG